MRKEKRMIVRLGLVRFSWMAAAGILWITSGGLPLAQAVSVNYTVEDIDPFDTTIVRSDGVQVAMNVADTLSFTVNGVDFTGITIPPVPNELGGTVTDNGYTITYSGDIPDVGNASYPADTLNRYNYFSPENFQNEADWGQCPGPPFTSCNVSGIMEVAARTSSGGTHDPDPDVSIDINVSGLSIGQAYRLQFLLDVVDETRIMTIDQGGQRTPWLSTGQLITDGAGGLEEGAHADDFAHPGHDGLNGHGHSVLAEFTADATSIDFSVLATHFSRAAINAVSLAEVTATGTPGDYNGNGIVDAADYSVWLDNLGAPAGTLPNDSDGGAIGEAQYTTWKTSFGNSGSAAGMATTVPEPGTLALVFLMGISLLATTGRSCRMY